MATYLQNCTTPPEKSAMEAIRSISTSFQSNPNASPSQLDSVQLQGKTFSPIQDGTPPLNIADNLDNVEELGKEIGQKAVEDLDHDERKVEEPEPVDLMEIQKISEYLDAVALRMDKPAMDAFAKAAQSQDQSPGELARQRTKDPTQQYALLQYALAAAKESGASPDVLERIENAIDDLTQSHGPRIFANLNTVSAAQRWAGADGQREISAFQSTYQDVALGQDSLSQTMRTLMERMGGRTQALFTQGLTSLINALGADLKATRPSTEPERLKTLCSDLYQIQVMLTVLESCMTALQVALGSTERRLRQRRQSTMRSAVWRQAERRKAERRVAQGASQGQG